MSVVFQQCTQCYISGDRTLHNHCDENLESYMTLCFLCESAVKCAHTHIHGSKYCLPPPMVSPPYRGGGV
jgi:hypothetical protein